MKLKEFTTLLSKNTNNTLGNAALIRFANDNITLIDENNTTPDKPTAVNPGFDIAAIYYTNGRAGIVTTGEIKNASDILAAVNPDVGTDNKVWRMGAEIGDMLYVYDVNGVSKIDLKDMKSPTIVLDDNWTPGVNGFVNGKFIRRTAKR